MLQRAVEIIFRSKLLILLPLMVVVPIATAVALWPQPPQWQVKSTIWVDPYRPLEQDDSLGTAAATNQAQLIQDFLHTDSFSRAVLEKTKLKPALQQQKTLEQAQETLWKSVAVTPSSSSFLTIAVTSRDPDLAYSIGAAINSTYQDIVQKQLTAQATAANNLYGTALSQAMDALKKSQTQLANYISQHPEIAAATRDSSVPITAMDSNFSLLTQQLSADQETYNTARERYQEFQRTAEAAQQAEPFTFTVVDAPQRPTLPITKSRLTQAKLPVVGLMVGLMLSSAVASILILTSHTILDSQDVERYLGLPVVGTLSDLGDGRWLAAGRRRAEVRMRLAAPARASVAARATPLFSGKRRGTA